MVQVSGYKEIDELDMTWRENREYITLQARQLLRRVLNTALVQLDREFKEGLQRGEVLRISPDQDELRELLLKSATAELGPGSVTV